MNAVKQIKFDVYTPSWTNPEPNFYAWSLSAAKILPLRENVGEGKYKSLFRIAGVNEVLAIFKRESFTPDETEEAVRNFVKEIMALCSRLTDAQIAFLRRHACLPTAVYCTSKGRCGFILPLIPRNFCDNATYDCSHPRLFQEYTNSPFKNFLHIALQASLFFALYHRHGFVYGDISYNNICVDPATGCIYVIDVDGVCDYSDSNVASTTAMHSPSFAAPETLLHGTMGVNSEAFTLAIFLYCILMHRHPLLFGRPMPDGIIAEEADQYYLGTNPIYVDHPTCDENRQMPYLCAAYNIDGDGNEYPWVNPNVTSARVILGRSLARLFEHTFVDAITSGRRTSAEEFAQECFRTLNNIVPCENVLCRQAWVMPSHKGNEKCPICGRRLERYAKLCVYRCDNKTGKYALDVNDGLSIYDFRSLYEINFRTWNDIFTSGCETGERLGTFQVDTDAAERFFFVSDSSKKIVFVRLNKSGDVASDCIECANGGRTELLDEGTILFQPDNPDVVLYFPFDDAAPLAEINLPMPLMHAGCNCKCREDWCKTPVSQKWRDWLDVWKCNDRNWLFSGGVPLGKCIKEIKLIQSELQNQWRHCPDHKNVCDCSEVDICSRKLEILAGLVQSDIENMTEKLIGSLQSQFKQVEKSSIIIKSRMLKAIERLVGQKVKITHKDCRRQCRM